MTQQVERAERSRDLERFITFVDAMVAIAITLLVLPLVEISGDAALDEESVAHFLHPHQAEIFSFLLGGLGGQRLLRTGVLLGELLVEAPDLAMGVFRRALELGELVLQAGDLDLKTLDLLAGGPRGGGQGQHEASHR